MRVNPAFGRGLGTRLLSNQIAGSCCILRDYITLPTLLCRITLPTLLCIFAAIDEPVFFTGEICYFCSYVRIMDHRANLENLACHYPDATIEEGPSTPDKLVSGLSEEDQDEEMWAVPVQEKGPHLPEELAMTT